jgi:hypothetical protein
MRYGRYVQNMKLSVMSINPCTSGSQGLLKMPLILQSTGDLDVRKLNSFFNRLMGAKECTAPDHEKCQEQQREQEEAEFKRRQHEYLQRAEDELATIMRERERG